MTSTQRVIKYFAIAFAACLIFGIFSAIIFGGMGLFTALGSIKSEAHLELDCNTVNAPCLSIAAGVSELEVKTGPELSVDADTDVVEVKKDGDKLSVVETSTNVFSWFSKNDRRKVTVYVPENMVFEKADINSGTGRIYVENLKAKSLKASLGIGEVKFTNLTVDKAKFDCGIGSVKVDLVGSSDDYEIEVDKGIGSINFNGKSVKDHATLGSGERKIEVDGGIGEINITTAKSDS